MIRLGDFIFEHSGNLILNDQNEVFQFKPLRNRTKNGYSLSAEKLTIPGRKSQRKISCLSMSKNGRTLMLMKDGASLTLHFGMIIPKENQGHCLKINAKYQIQNIQVI